LQMKAVGIIKRLYGLKGPFDWKPALHDRKAKAVFDKLMRGEEIPEAYRCHHVDPEPVSTDSWGRLGFW